MILDSFPFFLKSVFFNQKDHVVKCLWHSHRSFSSCGKRTLLFYHGLEALGNLLAGTTAERMSVSGSLQAKGESCSQVVHSAAAEVTVSLLECSCNCHPSDLLQHPSGRDSPHWWWIYQYSFCVLSENLE